jgi:hypothetical protein
MAVILDPITGITFNDGSIQSSLIRSVLAGLTLSTAGASSTMSIAAGQAADSTNAALMNLAATSKTTAAWAVGAAAGGLDTGAIANSTWYHFHVIRRPDTGVVDVLFSLSATAPTLPANYTQFRRIGSGKTNGSAQWIGFSQKGDTFLWTLPVSDLNIPVSPGLVASTSTAFVVSAPTGIKVDVLIAGWMFHASATAQMILHSPDTSAAGGTIGATFGIASATYGTVAGAPVRSDTSAQIRYYANITAIASTLSTNGWVDTRGKEA